MDIQIRVELINLPDEQAVSDMLDKVYAAVEEAAGDNFDYALWGPSPNHADTEWEEAGERLSDQVIRVIRGNA